MKSDLLTSKSSSVLTNYSIKELSVFPLLQIIISTIKLAFLKLSLYFQILSYLKG